MPAISKKGELPNAFICIISPKKYYKADFVIIGYAIHQLVFKQY